LFKTAEESRIKSKNILLQVEKIFTSAFKGDTLPKKKLTYEINFHNLTDAGRWDPHYHNPCFQDLRSFAIKYKRKETLINETENIIETINKDYDQKLGYIEISDVNNATGLIENWNLDYIKKLPTGGKIKLQKNDILVSKVRPYRNIITIFDEQSEDLFTASKGAFAVYRGIDNDIPYYIWAFLRHPLGLNQIVMKQSGTSYPTVSEDDISTVEILKLDEPEMKKISNLCLEYFSIKLKEKSSQQAIIKLMQNL
jgi:type I restriction enzyme S subunit